MKSFLFGLCKLILLLNKNSTYFQRYANKSLFGKIKGVFNWVPDQIDTTTDEPPERQLKALFALVKTLRSFFPVIVLGEPKK